MKKYLAFMFAALAIAFCGQRIDLDVLANIIQNQARKHKSIDAVLINKDVNQQETQNMMENW